MNRQIYDWIRELVRDKPDQTTSRRISLIGSQVLARYGCGYISNNCLVFNAEHKRRLRQRVKDEMGRDPFTEQLPDDRLEMAKYHANEKLAAKTAGNDQLLLNSADGIVRVNNAQIQLYPESIKTAGLLCLNSSINTVEHRTIVVVENLAIMPLCHTWQLPLPDLRALWVYRGDHKSGAKAEACRDFLQRFGKDKTVIVFSDMDPKGLEIALTMPHAQYWLGPEPSAWDGCFKSTYASRSGYDIQSDAMASLMKKCDAGLLADPFSDLVLRIKKERSSYRQEHGYAHNVGLSLFPIKQEIALLG
ncbi:MAG: hypothetical protein M0R47_08985 [Methylobacter sp.]|uniref:DUF7281 domain-containing protein n=1 Tax=Methylobacter sp. TaxID=2051955 RepID=UPI0025E41E69|nr:hypothetical protein [Methylobacter sp.]MCK9620653.1 hypothetical protein [Methylobacter sp.]